MRVTAPYKQPNSAVSYILSGKSPLKAPNVDKSVMEISVTAADHKKIEQLEKYKKTAEQAAHDIRNPLQTLSMTLDHRFKSLSKEERMLLKNLTNSIKKIAQVLLDSSKKECSDDHQYIMISRTLAEVVEQKEIQYIGENVEFEYSFDPALKFAFIYGNALNFERMISNLINNSVEAFDGKHGAVKVGFSVDNNNVKIVIEDNGKGMSPGMVEKLTKGEPVSTSKVDGHGIGTQQIRDTLAELGGTQVIKSMLDVGTKITLTIPKSNEPKWVMKKVYLSKGDVVVILDDDVSIHQKWQEKLGKYTPKISLNFFTDGQEAIDFINSYRYKDDIRLLSDYELRGQGLNGLDVVQKCGLRKYRASLISGAYSRKEIQDKAAELNVSILPKAFLDVVPIDLDGRIENDMSFADANVIVIDDNESFANAMSDVLKADGFIVDTYYDPKDLMINLSKYNAHTKIITDNCFDGGMNGDALVEHLYEKGFKNVCVFSGYEKRDICSKYPLETEFVTKGESDIDKLISWCKNL